MMMQPDQNEMKQLLHAVDGRNVILEHILCLDCDGNNNENIMLIFLCWHLPRSAERIMSITIMMTSGRISTR